MSAPKMYAIPPYFAPNEQKTYKELKPCELVRIYSLKFNEIQKTYPTWNFNFPEVTLESNFDEIHEIYVSIVNTIIQHLRAMKFKVALCTLFALLNFRAENKDIDLLKDIHKYDRFLFEIAGKTDLIDDSAIDNLLKFININVKDRLISNVPNIPPFIRKHMDEFFQCKSSYDEHGLIVVPEESITNSTIDFLKDTYGLFFSSFSQVSQKADATQETQDSTSSATETV